MLLCLHVFTTEQNCSTEGEVYSQRQMQDCIPTCSNPYPACSGMIQEGCHCPHGTVLDETQNKCVPLSKCSKILIMNIIYSKSLQSIPNYRMPSRMLT